MIMVVAPDKKAQAEAKKRAQVDQAAPEPDAPQGAEATEAPPAPAED
jgi:hypothetical protein